LTEAQTKRAQKTGGKKNTGDSKPKQEGIGDKKKPRAHQRHGTEPHKKQGTKKRELRDPNQEGTGNRGDKNHRGQKQENKKRTKTKDK
jgi:hypothetical protein